MCAHRNQSKIVPWHLRKDPPPKRTPEEYQEMLNRRISWRNKEAEQQKACIVPFNWQYVHEGPGVLDVGEGDKLYKLRTQVIEKGRYKNWAGGEYHPMILVDADGRAYRWIATAKPGSRVHQIEVGDTLFFAECEVKETIPEQGLTCVYYPRRWEIHPPQRRITL